MTTITSRFAAIDFETANSNPDSACSVGLVVVNRGRIVRREYHLIRPPTPDFRLTWIHGLTWIDVRDAPTFGEVWRSLRPLLKDVGFVAAHKASFDRGVLQAACRTYRLSAPRKPFICTVELARTTLGIFPTKLPDVCKHLQIPLNHHNAASDAEACARIVLAARKVGWRP
ncbi:MAG: 3'-5' exonuclease [Acidobacteria bacterium]|nr:3'-5' exonuclease [Acidobacteriota bacterium]